MEFENNLFAVENGGNTCYIDSLLMALFYTPSHIEQLLSQDPKTTPAIYLQEFIHYNLIEPVRSQTSVSSDDMNTLRRICIENDWLNNVINIDPEEQYSQQDVTEFFSFISNLFNNEPIKIKRQLLTDGIDDEHGTEETVLFIPLYVPDNIEKITIKQLLDNWLHHNYVTVNKNGKDTKCLIQYKIINSPQIIVLSINRFKKPDVRDYVDVIIQNRLKNITPSFSNTDNDYIFHAAVCHKGENIHSGHYYALINCADSFFWFDDLMLPSFFQVSMEDKTITKQIKQDCVLLIYRKN